jgi:predicted Zn-ribbon and HTH transcriptional regulator
LYIHYTRIEKSLLNVPIIVALISFYTNRIIVMRLFNRKQEGKQDQETELKGKPVKCKECGMQFESKERLKVHSKKAHSGRGERKKKTGV